LFSINESIQLSLGAFFNRSLSNISAYEQDANFRLTTKAEELNSIMAGSSGASFQAFGLAVGVRYFLK
jgi:hypothetical protein